MDKEEERNRNKSVMNKKRNRKQIGNGTNNQTEKKWRRTNNQTENKSATEQRIQHKTNRQRTKNQTENKSATDEEEERNRKQIGDKQRRTPQSHQNIQIFLTATSYPRVLFNFKKF